MLACARCPTCACQNVPLFRPLSSENGHRWFLSAPRWSRPTPVGALLSPAAGILTDTQEIGSGRARSPFWRAGPAAVPYLSAQGPARVGASSSNKPLRMRPRRPKIERAADGRSRWPGPRSQGGRPRKGGARQVRAKAGNRRPDGVGSCRGPARQEPAQPVVTIRGHLGWQRGARTRAHAGFGCPRSGSGSAMRQKNGIYAPGPRSGDSVRGRCQSDLGHRREPAQIWANNAEGLGCMCPGLGGIGREWPRRAPAVFAKGKPPGSGLGGSGSRPAPYPSSRRLRNIQAVFSWICRR